MTLPTDPTQEAAERLIAASGRPTLGAALYWLASGGGLKPGAEVTQVLRDLVVLSDSSDDATKALTVVARSAARSDFDSSSVLFGSEGVRRPAAFRSTLLALAKRCEHGTLNAIRPEVLLEAQRADPFTVEALCAVAGLSYAELASRAGGLPNKGTGEWTIAAAKAAFEVIDSIVRGTNTTEIKGAIPARPIELMKEFGAASTGWPAVDHMLHAGVPYEVLLAQRAVGSAWLAHRGSTSSLTNHAAADLLSERLDAAGLTYRRSKAVGGTIHLKSVRDLARSDGQTGIVVLDPSERPRYAITFATAADGGTARRSSGSLRTMRRDPSIPMALVLTGPGWSERNETVDLAREFEGRVYTELTIDALVTDIKAAIG